MSEKAVMAISSSGEALPFDNMKNLRGADLPSGDYEIWRFAGILSVKEVQTRTKTKFNSAVKRPRKSRGEDVK